jgi:S-adenosylmethionine hydrolase
MTYAITKEIDVYNITHDMTRRDIQNCNYLLFIIILTW